MPNIRIKDIPTTASATVNGDFFAVDSSASTRKLNAFSPTFGGNATVTGTLTVNGTGTNSIPNLSVTGIGGLNVSANFLTSANTLRFSDSAAGGQTWFMSPQLGDGVATNFAFYSNDGVTSIPLFRVSSAGVFRLPSTAASTSTSSGALVVGNGTSGGLGVGGSIYSGANINSDNPQGKIQIQGTGNTTGVKEINLLRSDGGDACTIGLTGSAYAGVLAAAGLGNSEAFIYNATPFRVFIGTASTNRFDFTSSQFKINPTTASTSTSSGALVVSGGMGIAKQIVAGGVISIDPLDASPEDLAPEVAFCRGVSLATTASVLAFGSGARIGLLRGYQDGGNLVEWRFGSYIGTTFNEQMRLGGTSATSSSLTLYGTTASSTITSGALVVSGGVGVAGAINCGGNLSVRSTSAQIIIGEDSASQLTYLVRPRQAGGAIQIVQDSATVNRWLALGGCDNNGVFGEGLRVGPNIQIPGTTASTTTTSGALVVSGGLGLAGNLNMGGSLSVAGSSGISVDTTGSASLRFNDGASTKWWIYKLSGDTNLYYRDMVNSRMQMVMVPGADSQSATTALYSKFAVDATTASTNTSNGALVVSGGVGVGGQINAGSGAHIFGNAAATAQILVQRITTDPSSIQLNAVSSFANIDFGSQGGGFTFGAIKSNGSEILRIFNGNLAQITNVSGGGLAIGGGLRVSAQTASTSATTGAAVISGGIGIAADAYIGGKLVVSGGVESTISGNVQFSTGQIRVTNAYTPLSASATGTVGSITWDNLYIYVCVATNTWKRVAIATW